MESVSGVGLRVNSAVSASTSCRGSVPISTSVSRYSVPRNRPTRSSPSQGSSLLPNAIAGILSVNGGKFPVAKVECSKIGGSTIEKAERMADGSESNAAFKALLVAIAAVALAAETQRQHVELTVADCRQGRLLESGRVYRQTFVIRCYEVGVNRTASIETLMNHFQEAALNHVWISGLAGDGFGATHAMMRRNLIWVVTRMQVQVERYPEWGAAVEIDTWVSASGKNGMRRDWLLRDLKSGQIIARATSTWVMMNRCTRRLSKLPDEVKDEISPHFLERSALLETTGQKITKLGDAAQYIRSDLTPRRSDLDMNLHVNNVKYIAWIIESLPPRMVRCHDLLNITLEYRRECGHSDVVQSMTSGEPSSSLSSDGEKPVAYSPFALPGLTNPMPCIAPLHYTHLLRLQADGSEIVRGRTVWKGKQQ